MGIVSQTLKFKDEHLSHYWIRVLCFAFSIVFLALWALPDDVQADTPAGDEQEYQSGSGDTGNLEEIAVTCRQMNGTLWIFDVWRDPADSSNRYLYGYFSTDDGANWDRITVSHSDDEGYEESGYMVKPIGAHALSNNSIIVAIYDFNYWGSSSKVEITFICHWNNSDLSQWERVSGYASGSKSALYASSGVNATDGILFGYTKYTGTYYYWDTFNPATRAVSGLSYVANRLPSTLIKLAWIFWNYTGEWNGLFAYEPGTGVRLYCYNVSTAIATVDWELTVGGYDSYVNDVVLTANGTYAFTWGYGNTGSYFYWPYLRFRNRAHEVTSLRVSEDAHWGCSQLGLSNLDPDWVSITSWNYNTDRLATWGNLYYRNQAQWQGTQSDKFQESGDVIWNWDGWVVTDMPYQLYPMTGGPHYNHTQLPAVKSACYVISEYDDGDSTYDSWVDYETTWPGIIYWTWDPEPPEEPGNGDGDGDGLGEICSSSWLIIAVMLVMLIGVVGVAGQLL